MWKWLRNESNRGALGLVGGGVAALAAAGWTVFEYIDAGPSEPASPATLSFPIALVELDAVSCVRRGGRDAACIVGTAIHNPPTRNGVGSTVFQIPDAAIRLGGVLENYDAKNCRDNGQWLGQVFVDGDPFGFYEMNGHNSKPISVDLPRGLNRTLELRATDTNGREYCDDPSWVLTLYN